MDFIKRLNKERLVFDGSMGTLLQEKGLPAGELPEVWNITGPGAVLDIHRAYIQAGSQILKTNTFGANRLKLAESGFSVPEIISAGVALAKEAAGGDAYAALDIGPTGKLLAPFGDLDFEAAVDIFSEMVEGGADAGADVILIETMGDTYEIKAAMLAAKCRKLPVLVTFTPDEHGRLLTGGDILSAVCLIEALGADALGFNCGLGPEQMKALLPELVKYTSLPTIINPNAGMPRLINGKSVFPLGAAEFSAHMAEIAPFAQIIGGCCGTSPAHIAAAAQACKDIPFVPAVPKEYTAVSSYGKTVVFGESPVIIGERINPTGKPRLKKALREGDMGYLYSEGLAQIEAGAVILDVNAGLPDIDEKAVLATAVAGLQSVTDTPLQIDTSDPEAAESALRLYNGKPLLNSVSGKEESLRAMLPLAKKYGAAVVALTLDDGGIPETAQGRLEIAKKIIKYAKSLDIPKKDIIVDALTMTISTGRDNARVTLDTVERLRKELGVHTVLGLSNVSFGLPERGRINAAFYTLAMSRGLSAGILNPMDTAMMDAYCAYMALNGADINGYIARFSPVGDAASPGVPKDKQLTLYDAVISGLRGGAAKAAGELCGTVPPAEIIDKHLIPALDKVGRDYQAQKLYLPQLLMSAEAAGAAFEAIKRHMPQAGEGGRGKIVLATVKGDIHDIGKNIVKALLENYNFTVIDLGKNVEPSLVAETALKEGCKLVGLSALMTTTVVYMEETVKLLRENAPGCLVMAGGAVLNDEYVKKIGADFYCKDAMSGVRVAEGVFSP
jgi:5-methyltetrahydrofolate--homocysteine methyltransferase